MKPVSKNAVRSAQEAVDAERCSRSAHHFIFGDHCGKFLVTKDEHDLETPKKPFPDKPYLRSVLDCLLVSGHIMKPEDAIYAKEVGHSLLWLQAIYSSGVLFTEKSRQVMATWLTCAYILWRAKYKEHQLMLVQSKREDDAANLVFNKEPQVGRISFMESNLPRHLRSIVFPTGGAFGQLYFPNGSHIWAIPEGGDIIRSNTSSVVFSTPDWFQPQFGSSYTAALPTIKGGGQYVAVSSAEPGEFMELVKAA